MIKTHLPPSNNSFSIDKRIREKPFYTLHYNNNNNTGFCVQVKKKSNEFKTSLVAFEKERQAIKLGNMIENHKKFTNEWPSNIFDSDITYDLMTYNLKEDEDQLQDLTIEEWEMNNLQMYCIGKMLDLLIVNDIKKLKNNNFKIIADIVRFDVQTDITAELLNTILYED